MFAAVQSPRRGSANMQAAHTLSRPNLICLDVIIDLKPPQDPRTLALETPLAWKTHTHHEHGMLPDLLTISMHLLVHTLAIAATEQHILPFPCRVFMQNTSSHSRAGKKSTTIKVAGDKEKCKPARNSFYFYRRRTANEK
uniref:Uncharacterized protein n=1 Tax=Dunaliella tertiolecta TaxID=3047 RepID=A0A7S3R1T4_DUNTE|mmetsp:Transcript_17952/g.50192  ORF Transcript_17952/g.50192 Transcript_17952/m.50192 type:complete len:140 (+) Transcript_17952:1187-1606(+)